MRRPSAVLAVLLLLLLPPVQAGAEPIRLLPTGHWVTTVLVNGEGPFEFIVDTAASRSAVFPSLRDRLALKPAGESQVTGASGRQYFEMVPLASLAVDGRTALGLTVLGLDSVPEDRISAGIVGADILSRYTAEFDLPGGRLRLHRPGTAPAGAWREISFRLSATRFAILEGRLDGRPILMVLDTGARRTIMNWAAARAVGVAPDDPALEPDSPVRGATPHSTAAVRRDFRTLAAGSLGLDPSSLTIADLAIFGWLGAADRPAMILGIDRLGEMRFVLDYGRRRLLVPRDAAGAAR